jgi:CRISPR-associated protein Cas1
VRHPVYIFSSGELRREGNTLVLIRDEGKRFIPITSVSDIYVFGECILNKRVLVILIIGILWC